jgi:hypothetical protein
MAYGQQGVDDAGNPIPRYLLMQASLLPLLSGSIISAACACILLAGTKP